MADDESKFISFLKSLEVDDWTKKITDKWTVKDVVAHMVGWKKNDPETILLTWRMKDLPWFYKVQDYGEFNRQSVEYYKDYSPDELIAEWLVLRKIVKKIILDLGEHQLRSRPDLFRWLFNKNEKESHYSHHLEQIKKVLNKS